MGLEKEADLSQKPATAQEEQQCSSSITSTGRRKKRGVCDFVIYALVGILALGMVVYGITVVTGIS